MKASHFVVPDIPALIAALRAEHETVARLRAALAALVDALPKCDECKTRPAERTEEGYPYCLEHGHGMRGLDYAAPLRIAIAILDETKGTP